MCHSLDIISSKKPSLALPQSWMGWPFSDIPSQLCYPLHSIPYASLQLSLCTDLLPLWPVNFKGAKALCVAPHCTPRSWLRTSTVATINKYMMKERISQWIQLSFAAMRNCKILSPDPRISNSHSPGRNLSDEWHNTIQDTVSEIIFLRLSEGVRQAVEASFYWQKSSTTSC